MLTALLMVGATAVAAREKSPTVGSMVTGVLSIADKQVPLPEGQWALVGLGHEPWQGPSPGAYGAIANLVLFRLVGSVVDAALEVNVNELAASDGWGLPADCARADLALAVIRYQSGWDGSCFFVTHTLAVTPQPSKAWQEALRFAVEAELIMPPLWLTTGFRVANRRDLIDARLHVSPTTRGVPVEIPTSWSESAWYGERLVEDARRSKLAADMARWAVRYGDVLEAGLKNRLDPGLVVPMPGVPAMAGWDSPLERRVAILAEARAAGMIDEPHYRQQSQLLRERGLQAGSTSVDNSDAALAKALTFQPIVAAGSLAMWLVGLGPAAAPGLLGAARAGVDTAVFYLHELVWDRWVRQPRRDTVRFVDFRYFGSRG